ncbi:hypothetical protein QBC46DRAFT_400251 [Diplogelasinospora grovesii]|uniref:BZIP domain-containing protein n=1 Tax=Diplogelasinospora grovesii TaxID=303347 RepID=A0AAN6MWJ1_9PEZI|nr:hypothetical protein QBC46DRAFT_400251 [Diplogelasinospora grovesii]
MNDVPPPAWMPEIAVCVGIHPLPDAWDPGDDWTGVTSTAERKKRQNRLNQRAYRRRKQAERDVRQMPARVAFLQACAEAQGNRHVLLQGQGEMQIQQYPDNSPTSAGSRNTTPPDGPLLLTCPRRRAHAHDLLRQAYEDYSLSAPRPSHLPVLIRLNVLNALACNAVSMGFPPEGLCRDEFISPYSEQGPPNPHSPVPRTSCPKTLLPTAAQRTISHHPWIDLFPFPRFRDNALHGVAAGVFDEDELCGDILDVNAPDTGAKAALITWGEPSDFRGWEASVEFLRKWGWLFRGCPELIEATNYWRAKRGEKTLDLRVS